MMTARPMKLPRPPKLLALSAAVALLVGTAWAAAPGAARSRGPSAQAAGNCSLVGRYHSLGPTYVERLTVSHTSCATGFSLIRAYTGCRLNAGGAKGRCTRRIYGFRFLETRNASPVQFVALVHATKGSAKVTFTYTENT